jgi:hypothetical protein
MEGQEQWLMPVIPAARKAQIGGSCLEDSLDKKLVRPYLKEQAV